MFECKMRTEAGTFIQLQRSLGATEQDCYHLSTTHVIKYIEFLSQIKAIQEASLPTDD